MAMSEFRTKIEVKPSPFSISHKDKILLTGSCFSDNIGQKLKDLYFQVKTNPFGVVYNPLSVLNGLGILLDGIEFSEDELEFHNELWFSWDHHSSFSDPEKSKCLEKINSRIRSASKHLIKTDFLIITFGTSWVYRLKKNGAIVANCHKVPAKEFDRILLSAEDIVNSWSIFIQEILKKNSKLKIIFTVSPVRHWKEGAHGNQLSKSILLVAIDTICRKFPGETEYFPAYEILLDDLRDYRFYADDLLHPNKQAIEYIWKLFEDTYFGKETSEINNRLEKLIRSKSHRVYNENTEAFRKFREKLSEDARNLSKKYSFLDLKEFY